LDFAVAHPKQFFFPEFMTSPVLTRGAEVLCARDNKLLKNLSGIGKEKGSDWIGAGDWGSQEQTAECE